MSSDSSGQNEMSSSGAQNNVSGENLLEQSGKTDKWYHFGAWAASARSAAAKVNPDQGRTCASLLGNGGTDSTTLNLQKKSSNGASMMSSTIRELISKASGPVPLLKELNDEQMNEEPQKTSPESQFKSETETIES